MSDDAFEGRAFEPHIPEFRDEASILKFTRHLRLNIIQTKTKNGSQIGQMSDEDLKLVMAAASDIDRQVLSQMKIDADNENADQDRRVAIMAARLNKAVPGNPYRLEESDVVEGAAVPVPDPSILEAIEVQDFEMELGVSSQTSAEFMKKYERD